MTEPNADLYGFTWQEGDETVEVVGPPSWESTNYVKVRYPTGHETIRPAAVVRRRKQIDEEGR